MPPTARKTTARKTATPRKTSDKYAPTAWGNSGSGLTDLECPSGQTCLVRRPGVEGLVREGVLHNLDTLTSLVQTEHIDRVSGKKVQQPRDDEQIMKDLLDNPAKMDSAFHMVDRVVCAVVVKPEVEMAPNDPTRRRPGMVYTDMIELEDKLFILNFAVGGSRDLERFREDTNRYVAAVDDGGQVPRASKRAARNS